MRALMTPSSFRFPKCYLPLRRNNADDSTHHGFPFCRLPAGEEGLEHRKDEGGKKGLKKDVCGRNAEPAGTTRNSESAFNNAAWKISGRPLEKFNRYML
jgi:uncharacterized protein (DUF2141 family)